MTRLKTLNNTFIESIGASLTSLQYLAETMEDSKTVQSLVNNYDWSQSNDKHLEYNLACWVAISMSHGVFINREWLRNFTKQEILIAWTSLATKISQIKSRKTHIVYYVNALARFAFTM
jgi:hypothetical protein